MSSPIALESLIQAGRSAFYKDLVTLFDNSQSHLREDSKASMNDVYSSLKSIDFIPKMKTLIKTYMGIDLNRLIIIESSSVNAQVSIQPTSEFFSKIQSHQKTPGMMIAEIDRVYDDKKGRLSNSDYERLPIWFSLMLSTAWWNTRNETGDFYFTAEELAAATLHEIGHIDHYIRSLYRMYKRVLDAGDIVDYIQTTPNREVVLALVASLKKSASLDKSWKNVLDAVDTYFTTTNSFDDPYYWEALSSLTALVAAEVSSSTLVNLLGIDDGVYGQVKTNTHSVDAERSADEFAARNGAYAALVSVTAKTDKLESTDAKLKFDQTSLSMVSSVFGLLQRFASTFDVGAEQVSSGYDPLIRRMELVVETAKHAFHNTNLSTDVKTDIKAQIQEAEKYIALYSSSNHHRVRAAIKTWKDNVGKLGRIVSSPFQNRLSKDYEKLQNSTRSLSRNPLYYLASK